MDSLLLALLPANNAWMPFVDFRNAALAAGLRPELWRRLKRTGEIEARINPDTGVHELRVATNG